MLVNLVSNISNGAGLQMDYELLRASLESRGHKVQGVPFKQQELAPVADLSIFLEVVEEKLMSKRNWVIPNPEWWFNGWDSLLPRFEFVLAKTQHAKELFEKKHRNVKLLGWKSRDLFDSSIRREPRFLHVAGKSQTKNTLPIIQAWRGIRYPLTVVAQHYKTPTPNVTYRARVDDSELKQLMNSHQFHIMPSMYEGWGHSLHEALGVGATVLTTDAPPMNDCGTPKELLIKPCGSIQHHAVQVHMVKPADITNAVIRAIRWRGENTARQQFLMESANFEAKLETLVGRA